MNQIVSGLTLLNKPNTELSGVIKKQESPAVADKPAQRLRKVRTVDVRAVGL